MKDFFTHNFKTFSFFDKFTYFLVKRIQLYEPNDCIAKNECIEKKTLKTNKR